MHQAQQLQCEKGLASQLPKTQAISCFIGFQK